MFYCVLGYTQTVGKDIGKLVDFVVPTGNFGNVLVGYVTRKMGVPIEVKATGGFVVIPNSVDEVKDYINKNIAT